MAERMFNPKVYLFDSITMPQRGCYLYEKIDHDQFDRIMDIAISENTLRATFSFSDNLETFQRALGIILPPEMVEITSDRIQHQIENESGDVYLMLFPTTLDNGERGLQCIKATYFDFTENTGFMCMLAYNYIKERGEDTTSLTYLDYVRKHIKDMTYIATHVDEQVTKVMESYETKGDTDEIDSNIRKIQE